MATVINVKDSMSTIQTKLNKGGKITFSCGSYKITKQLIIVEGSTINLNGACLKRCANLQSIFLNKATKSTVGYNGDGNITISNGTFEGMGGYTYDNLVTFFHSHDIKITNCRFTDTLCHAIELNSTKNVIIENCKFAGYNLQSADYSYRELIQLDFAGYSAFVLSGSSKTSKCYDGTHCDNITIRNNIFTKSDYRDYPYACIGSHAQLYGGGYHTNITITNNDFHCKYNPNINQPCLSFIGAKCVTVQNNTFDTMRVARIYSKAESYKTNGTKVSFKTGDGHCSNITITKNKIKGAKNVSDAFLQYNKSNKSHTNISKANNIYLS